jgi:hypothetical protein
MPGYIGPTSRYAGLAVKQHVEPDGTVVPYLERRFPPRPEALETIGTHRMGPGERLDHAAETLLGDPEAFWSLCDASGTLDPAELERPGAEVRVAAAQGVAGVRFA